MNPQPDNYKTALTWFFVFLALFMGGIFSAVNLVVDPYSEFNLFSNHKFYANHLSTPYRFYAMLKQDRYTLIFGRSRSGTFNDAMMKAKILNLSSSVNSTPEDLYYFLNGLSDLQWSHIEKIYYMLEYIGFEGEIAEYKDINFNSFSGRLAACARNMDRAKLFRAFENVQKNHSGDFDHTLLSNGAVQQLSRHPFKPGVYSGERRSLANSDRQTEFLKKLHALVKSRQVEIIYFTAVASDYFWCEIEPDSIAPFYRHIVEAVPELINLGWNERYSMDLSHWRDRDHHEDEVTEWEASVLLDSAAARKYALTLRNVDKQVEYLQKQIKSSRLWRSREKEKIQAAIKN